MKRIIFPIILLILLSVPARGQSGDERGQRVPPVTLRDLKGRVVNLSQAYRGKVALINFWATWCPPCRAEVPELVKLQREYGTRGLQIVGITYPPERRGRVRRFARRHKVNYPVLFGTSRSAAQLGVGEILPVTLVVDRDGFIRERIPGILEPDEFELKIKPLLK